MWCVRCARHSIEFFSINDSGISIIASVEFDDSNGIAPIECVLDVILANDPNEMANWNNHWQK